MISAAKNAKVAKMGGNYQQTDLFEPTALTVAMVGVRVPRSRGTRDPTGAKAVGLSKSVC